MSFLETLTVPFVSLHDCRKPSRPADGLVKRTDRGGSNRYVLCERFDQIFANVISRILTVPFIIVSLQEAKRFTSDGLVERAGGELRGGGQGRVRKPRGPADGLVQHARGERERGGRPKVRILSSQAAGSGAPWRCPSACPRTTPTGPAPCLPSPPSFFTTFNRKSLEKL